MEGYSKPPNSSLLHPSSVTKETSRVHEEEKEEEERRFLERLKWMDWERYFYNQPVNREYEVYVQMFPDKEGIVNKDIGVRDLGDVKHYSITELNEMTESFSEKNFMAGAPWDVELHKGKIMRGDSGGGFDVIVKTWSYRTFPCIESHFFPTRMHNEIQLLRNDLFKSETNLLKLIGFHCDKMLALVFEGGPNYKLLADVILSDGFGWSERMKVATGVAKLLKKFHEHELVHGGIYGHNILIDENYSPKSFQFGEFSVFEDVPKLFNAKLYGRYGHCVEIELKGPKWGIDHDIFAYGVLLQELISKRCFTHCDVFLKDFNSGGEKSIVHESFNIDEPFGCEISRLAVECMQVRSGQPPMPRVLEDLENVVASMQARASKHQKIDIV